MDAGDENLISTYGLRALATVVFDVNSGQRLDGLHPQTCGLSEDAKKSLVHLSLPHCNNQDEGDSKFIVRFRDSADDRFQLLYGFVLFRQQKDESCTRGYFQKALVLVSSKPYVDLYDRVLRVIGPLYFKVGPQVLPAVYNNIKSWPKLVHSLPVALPLAGTYISCVIPKLLDYNQLDLAYEPDVKSPLHSHFIIEGDEDATNMLDFNSIEEDDDESKGELVEGDNFVEPRKERPHSPSFGDLLLSKRTHQSTPFESIGLYSSFLGFEKSLWLLWQLAITGESVLIISPHAETCSQAVLAFTSLIAPLQFYGDCRPYYTVYEADYDTLSSSQKRGVSNPKNVTVIGTTNPFFMKLPSANAHVKEGSVNATEAEEIGTVCLRIEKSAELDDFNSSYRPTLLRRCPRYVVPDASVLRQLISPPEVHITQSTMREEVPYITINNAVLRKHFRKFTKDFLHPFEQYFGIWKSSGGQPNLYVKAEDYMKPYTLSGLLESIKPRKLPPQIKQTKWKALYTAFVNSAHFEPWFNYRRQRCIHEFSNTLRELRSNVDVDLLLSSPLGKSLSHEQYLKMKKEMDAALTKEKSQAHVDEHQVRTIKKHIKAVNEKLRKKCPL